MSLKAFHIVFVIASILVCALFAGWGFWGYFRDGQGPLYLVYGVLGCAAVIALAWYGKYVLKKLKSISYL